MQLSPGNRKAFQDKFNKLDSAAKNILMGSAVSLTGSRFQGSGVLFTISDGGTMAYILTAKHNLRLGEPFVPKKTPAPSKMVDGFTKTVTVRYGAVNFNDRLTKTAALEKGPNNGGNSFIFGDASQDNWAYDVMMVQSSDADLISYARKYAPVKTIDELNALSVLLSEPGLTLKHSPKRSFLQIGFGYSDEKGGTNDAQVGRFQVRDTRTITAAVAEKAYNYDKEKNYEDMNLQVIMLTADNLNSTAPGDSGGPLFSVDVPDKGSSVVTLLGFTIGANLATAPGQKLGDNPIRSNASAYLKMWLCLAIPFLEGCQ